MKKLLISIVVLLLVVCSQAIAADKWDASSSVSAHTRSSTEPGSVNSKEKLEKLTDFFYAKLYSKRGKKFLKLHGKESKKFLRNVVHIADRMDRRYPSLEIELILAVIWQESRFNPKASYRGSEGLMQVERKSHLDKIKGRNIYGIWVNIPVGCQILNEYNSRFKTMRATLLSYNAGPSNYIRGNFKESYATDIIHLYNDLKKI